MLGRRMLGAGRHLELRDAPDLSYGTRSDHEDGAAAELCVERCSGVSLKAESGFESGFSVGC